MDKSDWITRQRTAVSKLLEAAAELDEQRRVWDSLDLGNALQQSDFVGENIGIAVADITAAVTSAAAVRTLLNEGHATNFYRVAL